MNPPLARNHFELAPDLTYLNHAAIGVLPHASRDAIIRFASEHATRGVLGTAGYEALLPASRARLARFVGARADEVAFLANTSLAANILARGLSWQAGDEIIINDNEFGSNALPWLALRKLGVVVHMIETARERMTPDVLQRYMSNRTRVVATSWVSFIDGYRHDLAALAEVAHAAGAYFFVDVIQALGVFPLNMRHLNVDAIYGGAQKWLLAEPGLGFLCCNKVVDEQLHLHLPGWRSVADLWNFLDYDQPLLAGTARFEGGTPNLLGITALTASLDVLDTAHPDERAKYVLWLTDILVEELQKRGAAICSLRSEETSSGIVTFTMPQEDPLEIGKRFAEAGIVVTARPTGIRVSPHAYSTRDDIERMLTAL